jgi:hypothetical protein
VLRQDVLSGYVFAFCNRRRNRVRCLLWDGSDFWLAAKRLERATFDWPKDEAAVAQMSLVQLRLLLEGFELRSRRGWQRYEERLQAGRPQPEVMATRARYPALRVFRRRGIDRWINGLATCSVKYALRRRRTDAGINEGVLRRSI